VVVRPVSPSRWLTSNAASSTGRVRSVSHSTRNSTEYREIAVYPWDSASRRIRVPQPGQAGAEVTLLNRQRWAWKHSSLRQSVGQCERHPYGSGVTAYYASGKLSFGGLARCSSVHACATCAARIRRGRAGELSAGLTGLVKRGGSVVPLTLTERHWQGLSLVEALKTIKAAWRAVCQNRAVAALRKRLLWEYCCPFELTYGRHGWHVHMHPCLAFPEMLSLADVREVEDVVFRAWQAALARMDKRLTPDREHVVRSELVTRHGQVSAVGHYVSKLEGLGSEISRMDRKSGKGEAPFEIQARAMAGDERALALWHEYERATHGLRAMNYSKGWSKLVLVEPASDEDLADRVREPGMEPKERDLTLHDWNWVRCNPRGREVMLEVFDAGGDVKAAVTAVLASLPWRCLQVGDPDREWLKAVQERASELALLEEATRYVDRQGSLFEEPF
jgi:hypothetical protein